MLVPFLHASPSAAREYLTSLSCASGRRHHLAYKPRIGLFHRLATIEGAPVILVDLNLIKA